MTRTDCNDRCVSTSQRSPAGFSDSDANDLCPLAADLDGLALCCRKPGEDQLGDHSACESIREQQRLREATRIDVQQRQRITCSRAEMRLSSERCHAEHLGSGQSLAPFGVLAGCRSAQSKGLAT